MIRLCVALVAVVALLVPAVAAAAGPVVFVQNDSTEVSQTTLERVLPAFQTAVSRDLAAVWGTDATLTTDPSVQAQMSIVISDDAECLGCLGWHDVVDGSPAGFVYARTSAESSEDWQLVFTHELFEMLVDPWINRLSEWNDRMWLVEVADPCESGFYAYRIDGVVISDFVTPAWYGGPGRKDFTGRFRRAGQIGRHGYAAWRNPGVLGGWSLVFG